MYNTDHKNEPVNAGAQMLVDLKQIVGEVKKEFNDSEKYLKNFSANFYNGNEIKDDKL
jgi:hypothetical protein